MNYIKDFQQFTIQSTQVLRAYAFFLCKIDNCELINAHNKIDILGNIATKKNPGRVGSGVGYSCE